MVKHIMSGTGSFFMRASSLGQFLRIDPILFVAFGLVFIAEPHLLRMRARIGRMNGEEPIEELLDVNDIDEGLLLDFEVNGEDTLEPELGSDLEAAQEGNEVILPASVLRPCRSCNRKDVVATNVIIKCGHFPFCNGCVEKKTCSICEAKGVKHEVNASEPFAMGLTSKELAKPPGNINISDNLTISRSCAVCQEREGLLTLMPCGHLLFCGPCVLGFRRCPYCSSRIVRAIRGFDVRHNEIVTNTAK